MDYAQLCARFAIPGAAEFKRRDNGLVYLELRTAQATARLELQGAHLSHWQPAGEKPVLFTSGKALYERGRPLRGGIPICFPWFGPHPTDPAAPAHGVARIRDWEVEALEAGADGQLSIGLILPPVELRRVGVPSGVSLRCKLTIGGSLQIVLEVANASSSVFRFEEALHPYFTLGDATRISITGTEDTAYLDKTDGQRRKRQGLHRLQLECETDRTYLDTESTCRIDDPVLGRHILIEKQGSASTVIWNPWSERARGIGDLDAEEWRAFVCVETANVADNAVRLRPGERHLMTACYRVGHDSGGA